MIDETCTPTPQYARGVVVDVILPEVCLPELNSSPCSNNKKMHIRVVQIRGCAGAGTLHIKAFFATISNFVYKVCRALLREAVVSHDA